MRRLLITIVLVVRIRCKYYIKNKWFRILTKT
jgi:hypothetical protein